MQAFRLLWRGALLAAALLGPSLALAADHPAPKEADWTAKDFRFHTGEVVPALRIHYTTIGSPSSEPVLVLHGTAGSGTGMLSPIFAGELFGPGQPLDASKYFVILPDAIGAGKSSKPSDGLRAKFPRYNYDDMVLAQYRLVTEGLGIRRLRLVLGNSMGGMHAWLWAVKYPDFMDAVVPLACQPSEMSGRNWMMRRMLIDAVRKDPDLTIALRPARWSRRSSSSARSSAVRLEVGALRGSRRAGSSRLVPGMGTIHGFCAEQPGERHLTDGGVLALGDRGDEVDEREVGLERLALEARKGGADVALAELGLGT